MSILDGIQPLLVHVPPMGPKSTTAVRKPLSTATLARLLVAYPPITAKVMAAIYIQAARLWIKRTPFFPHP